MQRTTAEHRCHENSEDGRVCYIGHQDSVHSGDGMVLSRSSRGPSWGRAEGTPAGGAGAVCVTREWWTLALSRTVCGFHILYQAVQPQ